MLEFSDGLTEGLTDGQFKKDMPSFRGIKPMLSINESEAYFQKYCFKIEHIYMHT